MVSRLREIAIQVINRVVPLTADELAVERIKVCEECEHFAHLARQCKLCWCFCDLKTKVAEAQCPAGKW